MRKLSILAVAVAALLIGAASAADQTNVVGFWTINLEPGFNLVSFPVLPNTPTLDAVIGDRLGEVEVSTWDSRLNAYRWARFNPDKGRWSGNLFLLSRGAAYWINLVSAPGQMSLRVVGHPEVYTRVDLAQLGAGWRFFGPTYGHEQPLSTIPARQSGDLLLAWDKASERFLLSESNAQGAWTGSAVSSLLPDRGYLFHLAGRQVRDVNRSDGRAGAFSMEGTYNPPAQDPKAPKGVRPPVETAPWPVLVSNSQGLPVCYENGDVCENGLVVSVIRERARLGLQEQVESFHESLGEFDPPAGVPEPGKFRVPLTVSYQPEHLNPGDRIFLSVRGPGNSTTRSQTFEVPDIERFISDISFPDPLISEGSAAPVPQRFAVSSPFPNPFNDRFSLEFSLPESRLVEYRLYDVSGRLVRQEELPLLAGRHRLTIPAGNLTAGLYILEVQAGGHRGFVKVAHIK